MIEKLEACPRCNTGGDTWSYDAQFCIHCGYRMRIAIVDHPFNQVRDFHEKFGHPINKEPINLDCTNTETQALLELRHELIKEEFDEFDDAYFENNEIEMLDALCDLIYVIYGMAIALGWDINSALAEVHRSNMSKLGVDGKPIVREDGKILKGENYSPPDLAQFFRRK